MKRIVLLAALLVVAISLWNCRDDRIIEAPPTLSGDYMGWYIYKLGATPPESMFISVRFTDEAFRMRRDTLEHPGRERTSCDADGKYVMSNRVDIYAEDSQDSNATREICILARAPFTTYSVSQPTDSVKLESSVTTDEGTVERKLILERQ